MVKLEQYLISSTQNSWNLGDQWFYKISEVLQSAYILPSDTKSNTFYVNNYIEWNQFN